MVFDLIGRNSLPDLQFYLELARKDEARMASVLDAITSSSEFQMGSYFGRWCTEAVGVVRAFNIDDSLYLGFEHYP